MFELSPYDRRNHDMFSYFDPFGEDFFADLDREFVPFRTDIEDKGANYELKADMPGFDKKDIKIDVNGDNLVISAEHHEDDKIHEHGKMVRRERRYGSVRRSFDVSGVDTDKIEADYRDGVLYMILPKKGETKPASHRIELK